MSVNPLQKSKNFLYFLLDENITKKQIQTVLFNTTSNHLLAISEIFLNLLENKYLKLSYSVKTFISKHKRLLTKFSASFKKGSLQRKIIKRHYKVIYSILKKTQKTINSSINK